MRKREEIEESTEYPINHLSDFPHYALTQLQLLQLEVLLDIRELLNRQYGVSMEYRDNKGEWKRG